MVARRHVTTDVSCIPCQWFLSFYIMDHITNGKKPSSLLCPHIYQSNTILCPILTLLALPLPVLHRGLVAAFAGVRYSKFEKEFSVPQQRVELRKI